MNLVLQPMLKNILTKMVHLFSMPITNHDYDARTELYIICPNTQEEDTTKTSNPFSYESDRLCFDARLGIVSFGVVGGYKWGNYTATNELFGVETCISPLQKIMSQGTPPLFF